jgi:hypothetical protein
LKIIELLSISQVVLTDGAKTAALKFVYINAMVNPIFYGICRKNYRKGYSYVAAMLAHFITCGCLDKPGGKYMYCKT